MSKSKGAKFRLYLAGDQTDSLVAIAAVNAMCRTLPAGRNEVEAVDVRSEPTRAPRDGFTAVPTVVKLAPGLVRRILGSLAGPQALAKALSPEAQRDNRRSIQ